MKVGAAIYSMLKDDSAVSALVGTRIYPELAEEGAATPYVVYSVVSNTPIDTKDSAPVDEAQLEVFSVADTYAAANDLADKVRTALSRQDKTIIETVKVQSIKYTNEVTEVSAERNMYISVQDYTARIMPVPLLLDVYPGAAAAYSLRKIRQAYTGPAITVRRESDDAEQNIGFDNQGNLDTTALATFCNNTNGFVKTWFTQVGSRDATQDTADYQPKIYDSSAGVITQGSKPAIDFDGVDDVLQNNLLLGDLDLTDLLVVATYNQRLRLGSAGTVPRFYLQENAFSYNTLNTISYDAVLGHNVASFQVVGSTQEVFYNGTSKGTGSEDQVDFTPTLFNIGLQGSSGYQDGKLQSVIVYNSDQSANRTGIESNINTHYSIY
jgi:hypothetical protein